MEANKFKLCGDQTIRLTRAIVCTALMFRDDSIMLFSFMVKYGNLSAS